MNCDCNLKPCEHNMEIQNGLHTWYDKEGHLHRVYKEGIEYFHFDEWMPDWSVNLLTKIFHRKHSDVRSKTNQN